MTSPLVPTSSRCTGTASSAPRMRRTRASREPAYSPLRRRGLVGALVDDEDLFVFVDHPRQGRRRSPEHGHRLHLVREGNHVEGAERRRGVSEAREVVEVPRQRLRIARHVDEDRRLEADQPLARRRARPPPGRVDDDGVEAGALVHHAAQRGCHVRALGVDVQPERSSRRRAPGRRPARTTRPAGRSRPPRRGPARWPPSRRRGRGRAACDPPSSRRRAPRPPTAGHARGPPDRGAPGRTSRRSPDGRRDRCGPAPTSLLPARGSGRPAPGASPPRGSSRPRPRPRARRA